MNLKQIRLSLSSSIRKQKITIIDGVIFKNFLKILKVKEFAETILMGYFLFVMSQKAKDLHT